jgi:polyhydroxyalkanoate synthesis regulator phasin
MTPLMGSLSKEELEQITAKLTKLSETQKSMQLANKSSFKSIAAAVEELRAEVAALKARPSGGGGGRHHSSAKVCVSVCVCV